MIKKDFHGKTLEEAESELHQMISDVRKIGNAEYAEIITGHGVIKSQFIELFERYGLDPMEKIGNSGTIMVIIE